MTVQRPIQKNVAENSLVLELSARLLRKIRMEVRLNGSSLTKKQAVQRNCSYNLLLLNPSHAFADLVSYCGIQ